LDPLCALGGISEAQSSLRAEPLPELEELEEFHLVYDPKDMAKDTDLERSGLMVNTHSQLLICICCKHAIVPKIACTHLSGHNIRQRNQDLQKILANYTLIISKQQFDHLRAAVPGDMRPISGIKILLNGYWCGEPNCLYACGKINAIKAHYHNDHKAESYIQSSQKPVQEIFLTPQTRHFIRVDLALASQNADSVLTAWQNSTPPVTNPTTDMPKREIPTWLLRLHWLDWVQDLNFDNIQSLIKLPYEKECFGNLKGIVEHYFFNSMGYLKQVPTQILAWVRSVDGYVLTPFFYPFTL
jgi:hypothetical protein